MAGDNSRSEREIDSGGSAKNGAAEPAGEILVEKPTPMVSEIVAPASARLNARVIIEFAAMAVAIAAIAYLYFHH